MASDEVPLSMMGDVRNGGPVCHIKSKVCVADSRHGRE